MTLSREERLRRAFEKPSPLSPASRPPDEIASEPSEQASTKPTEAGLEKSAAPAASPAKLIDPAGAAAPVLDELRQRGPELMPPGVRLLRWEPKKPPIRLSECSTVTDTEKFIRTTLRQLEHALKGEGWLGGNWRLPVLLAHLEAVGCVVELEDKRRVLQ
jgi:hypothetical protein